MNYVYDQEFNLWAIKNAFGEHFYQNFLKLF